MNINNKHLTKYIKMKWEKELKVEISDEEWHKMWMVHHSSTNSRIWREFAWKNLIRFFITPKMKSRQMHSRQKCWRGCGSFNVDHSHIFWNCQKIIVFWEMICRELQQILGYRVPKTCLVLYLCKFSEEIVITCDRYLIKILLVAGKKAITRNWGKETPPTKDQWITIVEEIFLMEKVTHILKLQEAQLDQKLCC